MKTKQQIIHDKWDELGIILLVSQYDFDGWIDVNELEKPQITNELDFKEYSESDNNFKTMLCRPKSLIGIENNNGWIKIKSESELPKEKELFHFIPCNSFEEQFIGFIDKYMDEVFFVDKYYGSVKNEYNVAELRLNSWLPSQITHYQPIQKPNPTLF